MSSNEPRMVMPELSLNKKLGNIKIEQAIDATTIARAEKALLDVKPEFRDETLNDFEDLRSYFNELNPESLNAEAYSKLSEISFSIKSRAATGGFPLASQVANSLYKYCDKAVNSLPQLGHKVLKLHIDALRQIFEYDFPVSDAAKSAKLVSGLEELSEKYS